MIAKRPVGRPRHLDAEVERRLVLDAAYVALRDRGQEFRIADILATAGVSTRSFYRHFRSKDALLCAMYLRDAEWAAERLTKRLADAATPVEAVTWWIDEIFGFTRTARRAERVAVLGSINVSPAEGADVVAVAARQLLTASLQTAIAAGIDDGTFPIDHPELAGELIAAATLHAAGLAAPHPGTARDQGATTAFCLRALGAQVSTPDRHLAS